MAKKAQLDEVRPVLNAADKVLDNIEHALDTVEKSADAAAEAVEHGLEKVADVVPEALDASVHVTAEGGRKVLRFFRSPKHAALAMLLLSTSAGAALGVAGYFALKKRLEVSMQKEFDAKLEAEIAELRTFYAKRNKAEQFETPQAAVEALLTREAAEALTSYQGQGGEPQNVVLEGEPEVVMEPKATPDELAALRERLQNGPVPVEQTTSNIFVDGRALEDFDYEAEVAKRDSDEPYIITHQEFMENEHDWPQMSLVYYNGDDTLADDQDVPVPDIEALVGSESLTRFGSGSGNPRVVYVRNEAKEMLFEVSLRDGEFAKEVSGLRHSAPAYRFRRGDDE